VFIDVRLEGSRPRPASTYFRKWRVRNIEIGTLPSFVISYPSGNETIIS